MDIHKVFHRKCGKNCDKYQTIQSFPPSVEKEMVENYHVENWNCGKVENVAQTGCLLWKHCG